MRRLGAIAAGLAFSLAGLAPASAQDPPHQHRMGPDTTMVMPIPMPKGMRMMPGLVGLTPPVTPFLPGGGVDPMTLPAVKPSEVAKLADGDTLNLTAMLVRRTVRGKPFAMYGFNGQVPGPLIRVPQNATIIVRFHNGIDLPSTVHWHGLRLDNHYDGVPEVTQEKVDALKRFADTVYLTQTVEKRHGQLTRFLNLGDAFEAWDKDPGSREWRTHFHVPVFLDDLGDFKTTRFAIEDALAFHRENKLSPQLEIETYTWDVLPEHLKTGDIVDYVVMELEWVKEQLLGKQGS